ncbi:hypothetical protein BSKO_10178 [Bryopsis sp. KO-2023]|nr:hypothetical protein BSKO_10178 [Bryopsis sp. KO-2023]
MSSLKTLAYVGTGALALAGLGTWAYFRSREAKMRQRQANATFLETIRFASAASAGTRPYQEDRHNCTVADDLLVFTVRFPSACKLIELSCFKGTRINALYAVVVQAESIVTMDGAFELEVAKGRLECSGTTVVTAVVLKNELIVAGTGDCRAVLSVKGRSRSVAVEHSPSLPKEKKRIEAGGGFVDTDGYLNGRIAVSRSIGDGLLKYGEESVPLIPNPDVSTVNLDDETEFLVLSTDGVWLRPQTIIDIVRGSLRRNNSPQIAAEALVEAATNSPSAHDNVTATVICFGPDAPPSLAPKSRKNSMLFGRGRKLK